jgi:hypothetical protein
VGGTITRLMSVAVIVVSVCLKRTYLTAEPSLAKAASSCCTRYTRLTLSMNRMRMKMNVIWFPR